MKTIAGWVILGILTVAIAIGLGHQRWETALLRIELEPLREQAHLLERARGENARLKQARLPAPEVMRLRAEHAEWQRLRSEREALQARLAPR